MTWTTACCPSRSCYPICPSLPTGGVTGAWLLLTGVGACANRNLPAELFHMRCRAHGTERPLLPCRARRELSHIFNRIIQRRRASGSREDDILQCFIDSRYEKAGPLRAPVLDVHVRQH